jgi:hypothetical protein
LGYVGPNGAGGAGVDLLSGTLKNSGHITGGVGGYGAFTSAAISGAGIKLSGGSATNSGIIAGGEGHAGLAGGVAGPGGTGGTGAEVLSSTATLTNNGQITGGSGGAGAAGVFSDGGYGGAGGAGIDLSTGSVINNGSITGGNGGAGGEGNYPNYNGGAGGNGGAGVYLNGGTLTTSGTFSGGMGGAGAYPDGFSGFNGDAVQFGAVASMLAVEPHAVFNGEVVANSAVDDTLKLSGTESGGTPITLGAQFLDFSRLTFAPGAAWTVEAYPGAAPSGGLAINGFTTSDTIDVTNLTPAEAQADFSSSTHTLTTSTDGTLHFVSGPFSGESFLFSNDGSGGTDVTVIEGYAISTVLTSTVNLGNGAYKSPLTIGNAGGVTPSTAGAAGVVSDVAGNVLTNDGAINGGAGSSGGAGGIGLNFKLGSTVTNGGSITGGNGGTGSAGGAGGVGAELLAGTLTNTGSIAGGAGGTGSTTGGAGGAGVLLNGGTLIDAGTISAGAGGTGATAGAAGDAVKFGSATVSTLIVDPDALFNGQVIASTAVDDVMEVAGTQDGGTALTLGTQFTNFATLDFAAGAQWTVDATKGDLTSHPLSIDGFAIGDKLDITNLAAGGATASFDTSDHKLTITSGATTITLQFDSAFTNKHFALKADGHGGTYVELQSGAATLAAAAQERMSFVSDEHRALMGGETLQMRAIGSSFAPAASTTAHEFIGGFAWHAGDHGLAHFASTVFKA